MEKWPQCLSVVHAGLQDPCGKDREHFPHGLIFFYLFLFPYSFNRYRNNGHVRDLLGGKESAWSDVHVTLKNRVLLPRLAPNP